jgi:CPA2 family monovalent cation:H+ antiporter-2
VAIITCIITPIIFRKLFPKPEISDRKLKVNMLGANQFTLPVIREMDLDLYDVTIYHPTQDKIENRTSDSIFNIVDIDGYSKETLMRMGILDADVLVVTTGEEERNSDIALFAKKYGTERVIARVESPVLDEKMKENNIEVFSVLLSTTALLKALIESPNILNILTNQETALYQINMRNPKYEGIELRKFPFTGDVIFVRIFRGKDSIVPHGDTELEFDDRLIVTGSRSYVNELRMLLEYKIR